MTNSIHIAGTPVFVYFEKENGPDHEGSHDAFEAEIIRCIDTNPANPAYQVKIRKTGEVISVTTEENFIHHV